MSSVSSEVHYKNQLASDWMHRGFDFANETGTLVQALRCFDEAIALRRTLPLDENHFYRYGLSAGWINRGDAMARMSDLSEAVKSYDEALLLLQSLPLQENALYPRRLAITWINRGNALQKQDVPHFEEIVKCCREAIQVLGLPLANEIPDRSILLAGAWVNLAAALVKTSTREDLGEVRSAAYHALALLKGGDRNDFVSAEIGLKARHLLCRLAVRDIVENKPLNKAILSEASNVLYEALDLIRGWNSQFQTQPERTKLALDLLRFGCWIYENGQPQLLAQFLTECLAPELFGEAIRCDAETLDVAHSAICGALENLLHAEAFRNVSTPRFEPVLLNIQKLQKVAQRLQLLYA